MTTLPDWLVERVARGEVPAASRHRLEGVDPADVASRVALIRGADAAELRAHPPDPAVAQIEQAVARRRASQAAGRRRSRAAMIATAAACVVGVLVIALVGPRRDREVPDRTGEATAGGDPVAETTRIETTRIKGEARLMAFRKAGDRVERLAPGAAVRAGDVLQLRYNGGGRRHGLIASIDGAGAVTLHFPDSEAAPTLLGDRTSDLPHAYALDDAPRFERFFLITADQPIDVARTLAALRTFAGRRDSERAALDLPPRYRQVSLLLTKAR